MVVIENDSNNKNEKSWKIDRIEKVLQVYSQGLVSHKEEFKTFSDYIMADFQNLQRNIISCIAIAATIIGTIATIMASLDDSILYPTYTAILAGIGAGVLISLIVSYMATNNIKSKFAKELWISQKTFHESLVAIYFMKGFLNIRTYNIESITSEQLDLLNKYYFVIEGGIVNIIIKRLNDSSDKLEKKRLLRNWVLKRYVQKWKDEVKAIPKLNRELLQKAYTLYHNNSIPGDNIKIRKIFEGFEGMMEVLNSDFVSSLKEKETTDRLRTYSEIR